MKVREGESGREGVRGGQSDGAMREGGGERGRELIIPTDMDIENNPVRCFRDA